MDGWTRGRGLSVLRPIGSLRSACKKHMLSHVEGERIFPEIQVEWCQEACLPAT